MSDLKVRLKIKDQEKRVRPPQQCAASIWVGGPPQKAAATGTTEETGMNVGHHKKKGLE